MQSFFKQNQDDTNPLFKGLQPLPEGAVIVQNWQDGSLPFFNQVEDNQDQLLALLAQLASHSMIYIDKKLYHSAAGFTQRVASHEIERIIETSGFLSEMNPEMFVVLSCGDQKLKSDVTKMVKKWDTKSPKTPFTFYITREKDEETKSKEYELYRALRAYWRGSQDPILALSKNKGVSCTQFLSYAFKGAIVARLFPNGVPKEIEKKFLEIEEIKKMHGYTKLQQVDFKHFKELLTLIEKYIYTGDIDVKDKQKYLEFLSLLTKGYSINDFFENVRRFPEIWEFKGYVFYLEKNNPDNKSELMYEPYIMDHSTYLAWTKHLSPNLPSRILTETDFHTIQNLFETPSQTINPKGSK